MEYSDLEEDSLFTKISQTWMVWIVAVNKMGEPWPMRWRHVFMH